MVKTVSTERLNNVVRGYATAMLWANAVCNVESCVDGREIGECEHTLGALERFDVDDFSADDLAAMREEIAGFIDGSTEDFDAYCAARAFNWVDGTVEDHFGHDIALTRNGHGAGFWDRGLGDLGDRLTANCKPMGSAYVYVSESGVSL